MNILNEPIIFLLMQAICIVESGDTDDKVGAAGELGCMQITAICVKDINRIYGEQYKHTQALDADYSRIFFYLYSKHYVRHLETTEGRKATLEDVARMWNCGFKGRNDPDGDLYWGKVKLVLEGLNKD